MEIKENDLLCDVSNETQYNDDEVTISNLKRVEDTMKIVIQSKNSNHPMELSDSKDMAVRILDQMPSTLGDRSIVCLDVNAFLAVFIALKTECVYSPFTHHRLVRVTKCSWKELKAREAHMLCSIGWNLYKGALKSDE